MSGTGFALACLLQLEAVVLDDGVGQEEADGEGDPAA